MGMNELTIDIPAEYQMHVFGQFDSFAKKIERTLRVTLIPRGDTVKILGEEGQANKAKSVLMQLTELARRGNEIREQNVDYTLSLSMEDQEDRVLEIARFSLLTCVQQSVMNFGILMVQGLVNSFGVNVMAAFAAAVKIDSFAYMPVQDFGNAFSTFIAQNYGAKRMDRVDRGIKSAVVSSVVFALLISVLVFVFAKPLLLLFVKPEETEILAVGVQYLRIEGMCYCGIGILFLLYGLFRGLGRPGVSVVLTVVSLGTRVALAYLLAPIPAVGLKGIWWAVPIGWVLADLAGLVLYRRKPLPAETACAPEG